MHDPTVQPRPSIYSSYRVHAPWLPGERNAVQQHPLLIVGAGPSGSPRRWSWPATACARRCSAPSCRSRRAAARSSSRAARWRSCSRSAWRSAPSNRACPGGHNHYRGQRALRREAPHDAHDRFFPMTDIQQQYLEEYLCDACAARPLAELRWGKRCTGVRQEGASCEGCFVIADIQVDLPLPAGETPELALRPDQHVCARWLTPDATRLRPAPETVYDSLAEALDQASEDKPRLFLVKLARLNANALGDAALFREHLALALRDL